MELVKFVAWSCAVNNPRFWRRSRLFCLRFFFPAETVYELRAAAMRLADARSVLRVEPGAGLRAVRRAYRERLLKARTTSYDHVLRPRATTICVHAHARFILTRAEILRPSPETRSRQRIVYSRLFSDTLAKSRSNRFGLRCCGRQEFRQVRLAGVLLLSHSKAACPRRVARFPYSLLCSCSSAGTTVA